MSSFGLSIRILTLRPQPSLSRNILLRRRPLVPPSCIRLHTPLPNSRLLSTTSTSRDSRPDPEDSASSETNPDESTRSDSIESIPEPEPRPFLSYTAATLIALTSLTFLSYRLFVYQPSDSSPTQPLNPINFATRTLTSKFPISTTSAIFTLSAAPTDAADDLWARGIWSLEVKQPQLQISRNYTPLPPVKLLEESEGAYVNRVKGFRFLIRKEPEGEVSSYLHSLGSNAKVELRGPHLDLSIPDDVTDVVFLAGGTGIAPALQVAYALSRRAARASLPGEKPLRMEILWANRTREDVGQGTAEAAGTFEGRLASVPGQIEAIRRDSRADGRFALESKVFVDEEGRFIQRGDVERAVGKGGGGRKMVLVSGPEGFVGHFAGKKGMENGVETQGPVAGMVGGLGLKGWEVWKL